jgi:NADH dehydrogenase
LKIAVTGAGGFVGSNLIKSLSYTSHTIIGLIHRKQPTSYNSENLKYVKADIHKTDSMLTAFSGVDMIYHLVGIIAETRELTFEKTVAQGTANLIKAARECGVRKIIYLSALGTSDMAEMAYFRSKWLAEEAVRNSGLNYVILRPSLIFGPGDKSVNLFARLIKLFPVFPVIGDGRYVVQPIYINDLIKIMLDCIDNQKASGQTIEIGGPRAMSLRELIAIIRKTLHRRGLNLYIPTGLMTAVATILEMFFKPAPVTKDQIKMLLTGNSCENDTLYSIFEIELTSIENGLEEYLRY